jgi:energy-converting hydrogenase B subunit Q
MTERDVQGDDQGKVQDEANLVVTDPVQAGVMTVMLVARTAKFDVRRQRGRRY